MMIVGLASTLPHALRSGLVAQGLDARSATSISHLPPVALLFAAFLGYNPMKTLLGPKLTSLSSSAQANVTGRSFFPHLISGPFMHGLRIAFTMSIAMCLVAAACSALRGSTEIVDEEDRSDEDGTGDPMRDRLTAVAETEAESIPG
jgi:hypothetical protein